MGLSTTQMIQLLLPIVAIEFGLKIYCLILLRKDKVKAIPKLGWAAIILFINTIGPLFYLIWGREK